MNLYNCVAPVPPRVHTHRSRCPLPLEQEPIPVCGTAHCLCCYSCERVGTLYDRIGKLSVHGMMRYAQHLTDEGLVMVGVWFWLCVRSCVLFE